MSAIYILLGCLILSALVIIAIIVYCTSQCWKRKLFKAQTANRVRNINGGAILDDYQRYNVNGVFSPITKDYETQSQNLLRSSDRAQGNSIQDETAFSQIKEMNSSNQISSIYYDRIFGVSYLDRNYYDIYSYPVQYDMGYDKSHMSCFRGTLSFALRYDYIHRVLMLHLVRACHLPAKDRCNISDPYIKMYLLPDRRNHCKTRIHRRTLNPEFNEMFSFSVPYSGLSTRMLQFTVYDFDRFSRHDLIGNVIMRNLFEKSDLYSWTEYNMHIIASKEKDDYGDLLLYLCYHPQEDRIQITVVKAYNLRPMDITGASDPYVKIYHLIGKRRLRKKKTSIKRANLNPVYNEVMSIDLQKDQLDDSNLLIKVMDWDRIGSNDLLGCTVLGPDSPTPEGRAHWSESVQHPGRAVGKWHSLLAEVPKPFLCLQHTASLIGQNRLSPREDV